MSSELNFKEVQSENLYELYVSGEVDIYTSQVLKSKLYEIIDANQKDLLIECSELNYIDSTGLGIFVGALKKVKQYNKQIYISGLKDNIKKLFVITGLDKLFIIKE
ncbi:MAG: STAS domain-containing protein [Bacillota bacterium]|nr:STAS domain-containing protein [Bacillota bacterium]